jgi:hypothetical protein
MKPEYTITVHRHGVTISEGVPVSDLRGIMESHGLEKGVASMRLAQKLGMALVFAKSVEAEQEWLKEIEK